MVIERIARTVEADVLRQFDRQILLGHRHDAAIRAMDHRDRAAPIALARNAPVAQPVDDRPLAAPELFEPLAGRPLCVRDRQAVEESGIEQRPVVDIGGVADRERRGVLARRQHDRDHRQPIFAGEFEVALIMRRAAEDRAGAVLHQHEIGDIDRNTPALVERMHRLETGRIAALLGGLDDRLAGAHAVAFGDERGEIRVVLGEAQRQRMVRRERQERGAEQRVLPGREDLDALVLPGDREEDARAFRAADPVLLHQPHALRPAVEVRRARRAVPR